MNSNQENSNAGGSFSGGDVLIFGRQMVVAVWWTEQCMIPLKSIVAYLLYKFTIR